MMYRNKETGEILSQAQAYRAYCHYVSTCPKNEAKFIPFNAMFIALQITTKVI